MKLYHGSTVVGEKMTADKTLLQMKYARIIALIAQKAGIDSEKAMDWFYSL